MYDINIETEINEENIDEQLFAKYLYAIVELLKVEGNFSYNVVSPEEIRALNKEYREIDDATDVLTFRLDDDDSFPVFEEEEKEIGDIFICIEKAKENSQNFSVSLQEELLRLSLHGVMHLLGYDHKTNDFSTEPMLIEQEELLLALKQRI